MNSVDHYIYIIYREDNFSIMILNRLVTSVRTVLTLRSAIFRWYMEQTWFYFTKDACRYSKDPDPTN